MSRLDDVRLDELRAELGTFDDRRPMLRLLAAIVYKQGPSVPTIARWLDVREATVYGWFDRIEAEPINEAVRDRPRPGRPPKLSEADRESLRAVLREPPSERGYDGSRWTPTLVQGYVEEAFGVSYTRRHIRRLLKELSPARPAPDTDT